MTSIGNYRNTAITVGCWWDENKAVEQFKNGSWIDLVDVTFPYVERYICAYSMVTFKDELYLFGNFTQLCTR